MEETIQVELRWFDSPEDVPLGLLRRAADRIDKLEGEREALLDALQDVFALIDEGFLVRKIENDAEPGFAIKMLPYVQRLAAAYAPLEKHRPAS